MSKNQKSATNLPLRGIRVLVGRARHQAGALAAELGKLGAEVIQIPFIEIRRPRSFRALDEALRNLGAYDWLILTSANGVEAMWERMGKMNLSPDWSRLRVAAIGPATKKALEQHGLKVDIVPKEYVAESVVSSLRKKVKGKRILLVRAKVARDVIPRELRRAGATVEVVEAYETVIPQASRRRLQNALKNPRLLPHVVTFTSSSTVKNFVELLGGSQPKVRKARKLRGRIAPAGLDRVRMASIGPVTSSTLRELSLPVDIEAKEFTIPGLVAAIVRAIAGSARVPR